VQALVGAVGSSHTSASLATEFVAWLHRTSESRVLPPPTSGSTSRVSGALRRGGSPASAMAAGAAWLPFFATHAAQAEQEDAAPPGHSLIFTVLFFWIFFSQKKYETKILISEPAQGACMTSPPTPAGTGSGLVDGGAEGVVPGVWTVEQEASFLEDGARRTRVVIDMLANACPSLSIRHRVCVRLVKEGIIDESWRLAEAMIREQSEELLDDGLEALQDVGGLALHETPQGVGEAIDPVDILQIEVFTASAVKNIGRFNCEFVKGEKLGRGAFGVAWRCHHLVDEQA
jgi:hypothetical protein